MTTQSLSVYAAWSAIMADVQGIAKRDRNEQQKFLFRGIDAVMNAVGPALRNHGVIVVPTHVDKLMRDAKTTGGKETRECLVTVTYRVTGPAGDWFEGQAPGESLDSGDKATPKAMSVAYRTFLLQALTIPTDEPDPDAESHERVSHVERPSVGVDQPKPVVDARKPAVTVTDWAGLAAAVATADELRALWKQAYQAGASQADLAGITARGEVLKAAKRDAETAAGVGPLWYKANEKAAEAEAGS